MFPLLELAVQEAQAQAGRTGQGQCGQYGVYPDVVDDDLVVHQATVHVDGPVQSGDVALVAPGHGGQHGGRGRGRGRGRGGGDRLRRDRGAGGGRHQRRRFHGVRAVRRLRGQDHIESNDTTRLITRGRFSWTRRATGDPQPMRNLWMENVSDQVCHRLPTINSKKKLYSYSIRF